LNVFCGATKLKQVKGSLDDVIGTWEKSTRGNFFVFSFKKTRRKSPSLGSLIGLLAFAVGQPFDFIYPVTFLDL